MSLAGPLSPSSHYQQVLGREIHYTEWGDPRAPVLLAAHGLARTGRDMDELATGILRLGRGFFSTIII